MTQERITAECLVIGGGLAGAMAGARLAAAGREVLLVERERAARDKVCGEFLSPEAIGYLREEELELRMLGATPIDRLRFSAGHRMTEARLPFTALSLSRRVLDDALLARASRQGCKVRRGVAVERLVRAGENWIAELGDGSSVHAANVILASGKHDLRGWQRTGGTQNDLVAFKRHWRLAPEQTEALRGAMELFLFRGGYGGLCLVECDAANLCLVVRQAMLRKLGGWTQVLEQICAENQRMRKRLEEAQPVGQRPLAISAIPYGYVASHSEGLWRVGDQAAVIPSFTGDGMSIALHSGALAAAMLLDGKNPDEHCAALRMHLRGGMRLATGISRLLVTAAGKELAPAAVALAPQAMRWIAAATRIPAQAMAHAGRRMQAPQSPVR